MLKPIDVEPNLVSAMRKRINSITKLGNGWDPDVLCHCEHPAHYSPIHEHPTWKAVLGASLEGIVSIITQ